MSTFHGLEMAKQSLFTQQSALNTTGHNISNANTEGYSRQRVNFETRSPYPPASRNRPEMAGQLGTGVEAGSIERVRNKFLDMQYRSQNSQSNYWEAKSGALDRLERLANEPTDTGIANSMEKFWKSLQDLSANPTNSGAESVVAQRGEALADTFNYTSNNIDSIRDDLKAEINHNVDTVNSVLNRIKQVNGEISEVEPHGDVPNDLYDKRDNLVDELSNIINIDVEKTGTPDGANASAEGGISISLADTGQEILNTEKSLNVSFDGEDSTGKLNIGDRNDIELSSNGSLKGLMDADNSFVDFQDDLNTMVKALKNEFNQIHSDEPFFEMKGDTGNAAGNISVSDDIIENPSNISASSGDGYGNVASDLAEVFSDEDIPGLDGTSINQFFEGMIGDLGVKAQEAKTMKDNTATLKNQVEEQRMSVSSVSLDEEMSNMIKFQHAYNAAARGMTAVDEMLDRVINNMGLVGR